MIDRISAPTFAATVRPLLLSSAALAAFALPGVAMAQDASGQATPVATDTGAAAMAPAAATGNEIVVTARKQNETLQEVPVTVAVVGAKTIEDYHITKADDVTARVPTLNVQVGGSGSGGSISLRGVGSSAISAAFDSAVAFDFDGVVVSTMRMVQAGFFDTAQIEVLKGPQSLYFGKSATAGVLSIKSAEPTKDWQFGARASYEFEEHGKIIGGYASGPVTPTLGVRLAAQYSDYSRYEELQPGTPAVNNPRGIKDFVGRVTLNWNPIDSLNANFKFQYTRNENDGAISQSEVYCGANGRADEIYLLSGLVAIPAGYDCKFDGRDFLTDFAPALAANFPPPARADFTGSPYGHTDIYFGRFKLDANLTDTMSLAWVTGYIDMKAIDLDSYSYGGIGPAFSPLGNFIGNPGLLTTAAPALAATNGPGVPMGAGGSDPVNSLRQFTQEVRLASNLDGPINFMVGGFYEWRKNGFDTSQEAVNISFIAPDPITGYTADYRKISDTTSNAYSAFGSVSFKPTEALEISGGLRYTKEDKINRITIPYVHAFLTAAGFVPSGFFSGPISFRDSNVSPEATIKYKVSPAFNVFASFKTGYKSGGIDNSALPSNQLLGFASPDPAVRAATAEGLKYKSEKARGGEIGFKSELLDRTLTLNGTAYYYKYKDLQVQTFNATTVQFITQNAGAVTTKGVELEARYRTPIEGLTLSSNLSYLDGKYTADFFNPGADGVSGTADDINLKGRDVSRAPKWSGNLAFDWQIPVGNDLALGLGGNMTFSSSYWTNNTSFNDYIQRPWQTYDARVSFGQADGLWQIALVGTDLTDKYYTTSSGSRPFLAGPNPYGVPVGDDIILNHNRGRQIFLEGSVKF
ncbi:MAG: TonB-dependent receptor [Tsuneonella sp.]